MQWISHVCPPPPVRESEDQCKVVEERALSVENELDTAKARIAELEAELTLTKASLDQLGKQSSRNSLRSGAKNNVSKRAGGRAAGNLQIPGNKSASKK